METSESIVQQLTDFEMRPDGLENLKDYIKREAFIGFVG